MTETLAIFFAGSALLFAAKTKRAMADGGSALGLWTGCGLALPPAFCCDRMAGYFSL